VPPSSFLPAESSRPASKRRRRRRFPSRLPELRRPCFASVRRPPTGRRVHQTQGEPPPPSICPPPFPADGERLQPASRAQPCGHSLARCQV
jgi:hypothetical protein